MLHSKDGDDGCLDNDTNASLEDDDDVEEEEEEEEEEEKSLDADNANESLEDNEEV